MLIILIKGFETDATKKGSQVRLLRLMESLYHANSTFVEALLSWSMLLGILQPCLFKKGSRSSNYEGSST